jgi:Fur family peroxide stress response transcriptional regulator
MDRQRQGFILDKIRAMEEGCYNHGLSLTMQRRVILGNLASREDHPTADQIYNSIRHEVRGISRTTVYRVLDAFARIGLIQKISNPDAKSRFDANTERHHHAICSKCGKIMDIHERDKFTLSKAELYGFVVKDYSINFVGVCNECNPPTPAEIQ